MFSGLYELEVLIIIGNRISQIDADTFKGLVNVKSIDLFNNHLELVAKDAFAANENLENVNLGGSMIENRLKYELQKFNPKINFIFFV